MTEAWQRQVVEQLANHGARLDSLEKREPTFFAQVIQPLQDDYAGLALSLQALDARVRKAEARLAAIVAGAAVLSSGIGGGAGAIVTAVFGG